MAVKLYTLEELRAIHGLYPDKALEKMNGDLEIYSTFLDKFLNQAPRTIPRLKTSLKNGKLEAYAKELTDLRIDLADIFAQGLLDRANLLFETAEKGDIKLCKQQLESFVQALQEFYYEVKQCRTQDALENENEAVAAAAEIDIGISMINNKYSTVNKSKFIELYKRINGSLTDKAINLTNVLRAMGYDSELSKHLNNILSDLNRKKMKSALKEAERLLFLLGCEIPQKEKRPFTIVLADSDGHCEMIKSALKDIAEVKNACTALEFNEYMNCPVDFFLINAKFCGDGFSLAAELKNSKLSEIPVGFLFKSPTSEDVLKAHSAGVSEFFILPLTEKVLLEKIRKYMQ